MSPPRSTNGTPTMAVTSSMSDISRRNTALRSGHERQQRAHPASVQGQQADRDTNPVEGEQSWKMVGRPEATRQDCAIRFARGLRHQKGKTAAVAGRKS